MSRPGVPAAQFPVDRRAVLAVGSPPQEVRMPIIAEEIMAGCGNRHGWVITAGGATALVLVVLAGCGRQTPTPPPADAASTTTRNPSPASLDPRLHQPFEEAVLPDRPDGAQRPPDVLQPTGKPVGKLYTAVVGLWDTIKFAAPDGKPLAYRAVLDTDLGPIEIALRPDLAPNHVRSFIALARAGYYDGLLFEKTIHDDHDPAAPLDLVEAGCPLGTGEAGHGSIGYWLKPEVSDKATHDVGVVTAWHDSDDDADACKFGILLCKAPGLDGQYTIFGQVTSGLDTARRIFSLRSGGDTPEADPLEKPVVIRKVTIRSGPVENGRAN
jgi:cyclophilin family peptidyl-prolyl cis-trans isomerase